MDQDAAGKMSGLDGSAWMLSMPPGTGTTAKALPTLRFEAGRVSGSDGCNRFNGSYTSSAGALQFGSTRAATMMVCPTEDGAQMANLFGQTLTDTRAYRIESGKLVLLDAAGAALLSFDPQATGLAGTTWRVGSYNNGKQAVVGVIAGTALTLSFGADGKVHGSGGCNPFSGSYRADGETIGIGPLAATRKACGQPEGVMAQEAAFLRALESAATTRREADGLELRTAAGALAAMLRLDDAVKP